MSSHSSNPDKLDKETNHEDNDEEHQEEPENNEDPFEIEQSALPYIFRYNYSALQKLRMSDSPTVSKLAHDIFIFFQEKLIVRRYSEGGKYPNRMKYEEKVKFLMRAFDHRKNTTTPDPQRKKQKFNRQKQIQFFSRPQVRDYFLAETDLALKRKRVENERRIKDLQDCIEMALTLYQQEPQRAMRIFDQKIKRKQLPWTDNMFADMEEFSKHIYYRFTRINEEIERDKKGQNGMQVYEEKMEFHNRDQEDEDDIQYNDDEYQDFVRFTNRSEGNIS